MAKIADKFAATAFTVPTARSFDEVLDAADQSAERAAGLVTKVSRGTMRTGVAIEYVIKRVGLMTVGTMHVSYLPPTPDGSPGSVSFSAGEYLTSRATV